MSTEDEHLWDGTGIKAAKAVERKRAEWRQRTWMTWLAENLTFPFTATRKEDEGTGHFPVSAAEDPFRLGPVCWRLRLWQSLSAGNCPYEPAWNLIPSRRPQAIHQPNLPMNQAPKGHDTSTTPSTSPLPKYLGHLAFQPATSLLLRLQHPCIPIRDRVWKVD